MTSKVRFAPSPTGLLHVGNARIALANWLLARRDGGHFTLRFDDTDAERNRPEYVTGIEQDLKWLGLDWDDSFHQSSRRAVYDAVADKLQASGRLYPCFESEEELRAKRELRLKRHQPPVYDRAMLRLTAEQRASAEAGGKRPYWRFKLSDRIVGWTDLVLGPRQVKLTAVSDPVLIRADGTPLYTFTSVVDDLEFGITHIIRGEDHVTNTGIQLDLIEALGGSPGAIAFGHLPLLMDSDGGKLSKRIDSLSLRTLARDGIEPAAITSYLARLGTSADPVAMPLAELAASYDITRVSHAAVRFDIAQLLAMNARVLHGLEFDQVRDRLPPAATASFWNTIRGNLDLLSEARGWWEVVIGDIVPPVVEGEHDFLLAALALLPPEPWDDATWKTWTAALQAQTGRRGRALFHPIRLALTGEERGPELARLLPLMGRPRAAARLQLAAA